MTDEAKLRTASGLSALWDGEPISRVRAAEGATILPGRRLAMHIMLQPDVASLMLNDPLLTDQGLLSRMLVTAPESTAGTRFWREPASGSATSLKSYSARLLQLLEAPLPLASGKTNELEPRKLSLAAEARRRWTAYADHVERAIGPAGKLEPIRGLANKLPEHAARLAGILALVDNLEAAEVSADYISAGIALADHYATEALRLFGVSRIAPDLKLAQRLLAWLHHSWGGPAISLPDIYQRGLNAIGDKATAARMVAILEDHGWLARIDRGATINGKRRRDAWRILRED